MKKRIALYALLALLVLAAAAPYIPAAAFRGPIERSLEQALQRDVDIGNVRFTFFPTLIPSPGFALERVTIHEDPRAGIEPFLYMDEAGVSLRLLPLFARRLEFSTLDLGGATVNLVKTDAGPWNFQFLLERFAKSDASLPALRMRAGRVNFKFGDTKAVFYFNDADMDVSYGAGGTELRFGGAPSRSDRTAQEFGRFFVKGTSPPDHSQLDFQIDLEQSPLDDTLRLIDPRGFGMHGGVAVHARLTGPPSALHIDADVEVNDIHGWDVLPQEGNSWQMAYTGTLDLPGERLELASTSSLNQSEAPFTAHFRSEQFLSHPRWEAGAELRGVRLATLFEIARHMGATVPQSLAIDGSVSGMLSYGEASGVSGNLTLTEASLSLPDAEPLLASSATLAISGGGVTLEPTNVTVGKQTAEVQGTVTLAAPHALDLRISTRDLDVAAMRSFGLSAMPVIGDTARGSWAGWARYRGDSSAGDWTGESTLEDASLRVAGLAQPIDIERANVRLTGRGVSLTGVRAKVGDLAFTGAYAWDPRAARAHSFSAVIDEADAAVLQQLLAPALARDPGGFLARTLRLNAAPPVPAWLRQRRADGVVSIETLTVAATPEDEYTIRGVKARVLWDGAQVRLAAVGGLVGAAAFSGDVTLDLSGVQPRYRYDGEITGVPYSGGSLDFFGAIETEGAGAALVANARGEGSLEGRGVAFGDAELRSISACFEFGPAGAPRWKFSTVEITRNGEVLRGSGASQPDGRVLLEFPQGERLLSRVTN